MNRWSWGRSEEHETPVPLPLSVYSDNTFKDSKRTCQHLWCSPNGRFAVLSDALNRVLLLDLHFFVVLHVWKGFVCVLVVR